MVDEVPLRKYYENIQLEFPEVNFEENGFLESVLVQFRKGGTRTLREVKLIETEGLEFVLRSFYPLNDFFYGTRDYLLSRGVDEEKLRRFVWNEFEKGLYED